jgi:hypothetical protein
VMWLVSGIWVKDLTGSNGLAALCVFALRVRAQAGPVNTARTASRSPSEANPA